MMSRSGYTDDCDYTWRYIRWRGAVKSAFRGKRGQAFLKEMEAALEALRDKRLIADRLMRNGEVCALGAVGVARRKDMREINTEEYYQEPREVAHFFGIPFAMAAEIMYENDEMHSATPEQRYERMLRWIRSEIKK